MVVHNGRTTNTINMVNSTITLNNADSDGGGIFTSAANIYSSTIVGNGADADADVNGGIGGGICAYTRAGRTVNLSNTLVANNTLFNQPIYDDCYGPLISYRRNLFDEVSPLCTIVVGGGDGWAFLNSIALLGQLRKNGGPTETISLLASSPAINAIPSAQCGGGKDQRGVKRPQGNRCDIGAFEVKR